MSCHAICRFIPPIVAGILGFMPAGRAILLVLLLASALPAAVVYVKADATGADNGTSWANAWRSLVAALAAASSGDEIWMAAGTYRPDPGRSSSFDLKPGVSIYGGFLGTETTRDQRSGNAELSVLSGDLGTVGVATDNAIHVVRCMADGSFGLYDLTITGGYADGPVGSGDASAGGIFVVGAHGLQVNAALTLDNCRLVGNQAGTSAAIHSLSWSEVVLRRCLITGNQQVAGHGAIGNIALFINGTLTMDRCVVAENSAAAGSTYASFAVQMPATIVNCAFVNNQAKGLVYDHNIQVRGTTFAGNRASNLTKSGTPSLILIASIVMEPHDLGVGNVTNWDSWFGNATDRDPSFLDPANPRGTDGAWATADDGYQLRPGSPCIDFNRTYLAATDPVDLRGLLRPQGRDPDLGAYEHDVGGQAPVAMNQTLTAREDTDLPIIISGSDTDTDSTALVGRIFSLPTRGSLLPTLDGVTASGAALTAGDLPFSLPDSQRRVLYRPPPNGNGTVMALDVFTVDLDDGLHISYPASIIVFATAVNDPPTMAAIGDQHMSEDMTLTVTIAGISSGTPTLAAGDPGYESQGLTLSATSSDHMLLPDPTVSYTSPAGTATLTLVPLSDAFGEVTVTVTLRDDGGTTDGGGDVTTMAFHVSVHGVNDLPRMFVPVGQIMTEDQPVDLNCFLFGAGPTNEDEQIPNLTLIATAVDPSKIAVSIDWTPAANTWFTVHLQPVAHATGHCQVAVTLIDDTRYGQAALAATQICSVWIGAVNDPPVLDRNSAHAVTRGGRVILRTLNLLISDADQPPADSLSFILTGQPGHGTVELDNVALAVGATFTLQDLIDERVSYRHDGSEPMGDLFTLDFTDGVIAQPFPGVSVPVMVDGHAVPLVDVPVPGPTWTEGGPRVAIAPLATVTDADTPVLTSGRMTVTVSGGSPDDELSIADLGSGAGQIGLAGAVISYGGHAFGTWQGGVGGQPLVVIFSGADATLAAVQDLVRALRFGNAGNAPGAAARTVQVVVDDGYSGASPPAAIIVSMVLSDDPPVPAPAVVATVTGVAREAVLSASDPDSPALTWSLVTPPTIATFAVVEAAHGRFLLTPLPGTSGGDTCVVAVSDGVNPPVPVTIAIYVGGADFTRLQPRADPPREAFAGEVMRLDIPFTTADLDPATSLEFTLSATAPAGAVLSRIGPAACRVEWSVPGVEAVGSYRRFHVLAADPAGIRVGHLPIPLLIRAAPAGGG